MSFQNKNQSFTGLLFGFLFFLLTSISFAQEPQQITLRISCYEGYAEPLMEDFKTLIENKYENVNLSFKIEIVANPDELFDKVTRKEADLVTPSHDMYKSGLWPLIEEQYLHPLEVHQLSNYDQILPAFKETHFVVQEIEQGKNNEKEKLVYGIPVATGNYALAYNADIVEEDPKTWKVLWEEKYQNMYSICSDYAECNIYITALALGADYDVLYKTNELFKQVSINQVRTKLNDLAKNAYSFWQSVPNINEMDDLAFTTTWGYAVQVANARGMNWKFSDPVEGTTAWLDHWSICSNVPKESLKYKICMDWIDYCISPDVQKTAVELWGVTPILKTDSNLFDQKDIDNYNIGDQEYWEEVSFWGIVTPQTMRNYRALWSFAISQKKRADIATDAPRMDRIDFERNGIQSQKEDVVQQRYLRGKRLAQERRSTPSLNDLIPVTVYLPKALNYQLTLESIDSGLTKNQIMVEVLKLYLESQEEANQ